MSVPHVFVTQGDIRNLNCEAWLLPTNENLDVEDRWFRSTAGRRAQETGRGDVSDPDAVLREAYRKLRADEDAWRRLRREPDSAVPRAGDDDAHYTVPLDTPPGEPLPILTTLPVTGIRDAEELAPRLREFLRRAAAELGRRTADGGGMSVATRPELNGSAPTRPVPLLAVPYFGADGGGGRIFRGAILDVMLRELPAGLAELVERSGQVFDLVIVLHDSAAYALAQDKRRGTARECWASLDDRLMAALKPLQHKARQGRLVPFLGAGTSVGAGAPTWAALLDRLAQELDVPAEIRNELTALNPLDAAEFLRSQCGDDGTFGQLVARIVDVHRYGLAPLLLASLPAPGAITLNFDTLLEDAAADIDNPYEVLPHQEESAGNRWLLKLHGSVSQPETIVLTRGDHLDFSSNREALSALVKSHLMTHHMLFVGFGLSDEHFHSIVHDVSQAQQTMHGTAAKLATALTLRGNPVRQRLWQDKLELVSMLEEPRQDRGGPDQDGGRILEIFLDALAAHSVDSTAYFLAPHFGDALSEDQRILRRRVRRFAHRSAADPRFRDLEAWKKLEAVLRDLGWDAGQHQPAAEDR